MKDTILTAGATLALFAAGTGSASAQQFNPEPGSIESMCSAIVPSQKVTPLPDPSKASAAEVGCAVADWQLSALNDLSYLELKVAESSYDRGWVKASFLIGLDRFAAKINDRRLLRRVRQFSYDNGMELGDRPWHGDDQAIAAIYGAVALRDENPELMRKSNEVFDDIIAQNYTNSLEFIEPADGSSEGTCQKRWCWADAIFMAPPSWALATKVSGEPRYVDYAAKETRAIIEYLQDPKTGLFFRDSRYFEAKTSNGAPVFWSRGNGWVFAGLARFIEAMPQDHPERPLMVRTFQTMAARLVTLQGEKGYWPTSLLDPALISDPETSGTGFFGFGLAWGLNNGVLKGAEYERARNLAWDAMRAATDTHGKVGWTQQIGKDPQQTTAGTSHLYSAGGMLLFASEMLKLPAADQ